MGLYEGGTYGGNAYSAARQSARDRLTGLLDRQEATTRAGLSAQQELDEERGYQQGSRLWGDDMAKGATMGMQFGGPWGALIGGIAGAAKGQHGARLARQKRGMNPLSAFLNTVTDVKGLTGGLTQSPYTGKLAMGMGNQMRQGQMQGSRINDYMKATNFDLGDQQAPQLQVSPQNQAAFQFSPEQAQLQAPGGLSAPASPTGFDENRMLDLYMGG